MKAKVGSEVWKHGTGEACGDDRHRIIESVPTRAAEFLGKCPQLVNWKRRQDGLLGFRADNANVSLSFDVVKRRAAVRNYGISQRPSCAIFYWIYIHSEHS
jgi:hypothetical protein